MRKKYFNLLITVLLVYSSLYAQNSEKVHYELLLSEAQLFSQYINSGKDYSAYIDSAKVYAADDLYDMAVVFLEEYISVLNESTYEFPQNSTSLRIDSPINFSIKTGVDFNKQEFEFGYTDSDSILLDEINKPYIGIQADIALLNSKENNLSLNVFSRYDKENWTSVVDLIWRHNKPTWNLQFQAGSAHDQNYAYPEFYFTDFNSRQLLNINMTQSVQVFIDNTIRWKNYQQPTEFISSYFSNIFRTGSKLENSYWGSFVLNYMLDWNESIDYKNNDYTIHESWFTYNHSLLQTGIYAELGYRNNNYAFVLGDTLTDNIAKTFYQRIRLSYPYYGSVSLMADMRSRIKTYHEKTEAEPDYHHFNINSSVRWMVNNRFSIEPGYRFETRNHNMFQGAEASYIIEQNYYSNGFFMNMNYNNLAHWLLSMSFTYSFRRYPDVDGDDVFGIYNNRNIMSLFLIAQWNINPYIDVNLFVSYDNDDDLDIEYNSTRSSYYSAEVQYKF